MKITNPHVGPVRTDLDQYRLEYIGRYGIADVWLVDGWKIRNHLFIDFTEGGNDAAYPWMPPNTIWIDNANTSESKFILLHELFERRTMKENGWSGPDGYDRAHDMANKIEDEARNHPDEIDRLIAEEASKMNKSSTFSELVKDLTANSVHVPAAGGDGTDKKKKKPKKPATFLQISVAPDGGDDPEGLRKALDFTITKMDPEQRLVFGWASIAQIDGKDVVDKQQDVIPLDELEKAAYDFCLNYREQDDMHKSGPLGRCVECMVFTPEKAALGIIAKNSAGQQIYGMWTGFYVDDDTLWQAHKEGRRPEFSIGGSARREKVA